MAIAALMVDVDGVLIDGRPGDGRAWQTSMEEDLGVSPDALHNEFFVPYWEDILVGGSGLMERLTPALQKIAPEVNPAVLVSYWLERDSRVVRPLLQELSLVRAKGVRVYLATNQEHLRAGYLMETLGLAEYVDGMFYSARIGAKKPDSEFFARVQAAVAIDRKEILLIDDNRQNVEAARLAGWQAFHWTTRIPANVLHSLCDGALASDT